MQVLDARTAPAIYRLVVVTDDERHARATCKQLEPLVLNRVRILKLIDENVLKALLILRANVLVANE